jgi:multisubunit Na+/H+ antiporter MnhF subunit
MEGMGYLAVAYFGMLMAIALWTYTVVRRSQRLEDRLAALESVRTPTSSQEVQNDMSGEL